MLYRPWKFYPTQEGLPLVWDTYGQYQKLAQNRELEPNLASLIIQEKWRHLTIRLVHVCSPTYEAHSPPYYQWRPSLPSFSVNTFALSTELSLHSKHPTAQYHPYTAAPRDLLPQHFLVWSCPTEPNCPCLVLSTTFFKWIKCCLSAWNKPIPYLFEFLVNLYFVYYSVYNILLLLLCLCINFVLKPTSFLFFLCTRLLAVFQFCVCPQVH